jgi:hypothetical protein
MKMQEGLCLVSGMNPVNYSSIYPEDPTPPNPPMPPLG